MQSTRWAALIYCGISWSVAGCGTADRAPTGALIPAPGAAGAPSGAEAGAPSRAEAGASSNEEAVAVVQVETITTVQSSVGLFLSPNPERVVPAYVERGPGSASVDSAQQPERAQVDVALLFRGTQAGNLSQLLDAQLASASAPWSDIEHCFPHAEQLTAGVSWPLDVSSTAAGELDDTVSPEWRGWQDFRGLGVRSSARATDLRAPVATLDFETTGLSSPLILSAAGDSLLVTNRSSSPIARALLIYSHPGGVGVTLVPGLEPGEQRVTVLGPKEHPPETLLELARAQLTDFFSASVGPELAPALAAAKSIPFLETQGLRLVALLDAEQEPATVSFSQPVGSQQRVIISHSEILKPEEEGRVVREVTDPSVGVAEARASFGRFTQAKLEFAAQSTDVSASTRAAALLSELRAQ